MTVTPVRSAAVGRRVVRLIAPKALTNLIIGGVIPAVCFLVGRQTWGLGAAVAFTAGWSCLWQALRRFQRKPLSGLLLLGIVELGFRTVLGLALHSARAFFLAPAVATALTGAVYILSSLLSRPLLEVVLADFVPLSVVDLSKPRARRIIRTISIIYGAEQIFVAAITILMVLSLSTPQYVAAHLIVSWSLFGAAVVIGITLFRGEVAELVPAA